VRELTRAAPTWLARFTRARRRRRDPGVPMNQRSAAKRTGEGHAFPEHAPHYVFAGSPGHGGNGVPGPGRSSATGAEAGWRAAWNRPPRSIGGSPTAGAAPVLPVRVPDRNPTTADATARRLTPEVLSGKRRALRMSKRTSGEAQDDRRGDRERRPRTCRPSDRGCRGSLPLRPRKSAAAAAGFGAERSRVVV
jgi:hypothetical protein